jgi:GntR family transcriptional regulator
VVSCHTVETKARVMDIRINYNSGEPICDQAIGQIKFKVVSGELCTGDKLPSIRELAKALKINPTTVSRIYSELANQGIITLRQGQGAFVSDMKVRLSAQEVKRLMQDHVRKTLVEGLRLGMDIDDIIGMMNAEHKKITKSGR